MYRLALIFAVLVVLTQAKSHFHRVPEKLARLPKSQTIRDEKIVGGDEVMPNSIPYQVSLQIWDLFVYYPCGGSIIDPTHVLTSAHCCLFTDIERLVVVAGEHDLSNDSGYEQYVQVTSYDVHPNYDEQASHSNDVCIMTLTEPFIFDSKVSAATLPSQDQEFTGNAVASGWGTLSFDGERSDTLQSVTIPIVPFEDCAAAYPDEIVDDTMICAGEEGKDSCKEDGGGPLTCGGIQCGVVSWGYGCGDAEYPGVYARTAKFVDWVAGVVTGDN